MKIIGLTGGIASGKSTVARLLASSGVPVLDADLLARDAVEPGTAALEAIAAHWPRVLRADGTIDRAALGAIVFADAGQRQELAAIVLPRITRLFEQRARQLAEAGAALCVFEAATLFEERLEHLVDAVLLVKLAPEEQLQRLMARAGLTRPDAEARLKAQWPLEDKLRRSRWVVDNSGSEADLEKAVREVWERIVNEPGAGRRE